MIYLNWRKFVICALLLVASLQTLPTNLFAQEVLKFSSKYLGARLATTDHYQVLFLKGEIDLTELGVIDQLTEHLDTKSPLILRLNITGGLLFAVNVFKKMLRKYKKQIITFVSDNDKCSSAGISLFMLGDIRVAAPTARFGFHSAFDLLDNQMHTLQENSMIYKKQGVPLELISHLEEIGVFSSLEMRYFLPQDLEGFGVVDHIAKSSAPYIKAFTQKPTCHISAAPLIY